MPNTLDVAAPRGTGRPNKLLQADFASERPQWVLTLETTIPIGGDAEFEEVRRLLASRDTHDIEQLANLLIDRVPLGVSTEEERKQAKHIIAAAFGMEYPEPQSRRLTRP